MGKALAHHRGHAAALRGKPPGDTRRALDNVKTGGDPKPPRHVVPAPVARHLKKRHRRGLTDRHIGIIGTFARHHRAVHQRHAEPDHHQRIDHVDLARRQRAGGHIAGDKRLKRRHRARLVEDHIGRRRRQITDMRGPDHVTEINHPGQGRTVKRRPDKKVVIIAVAMNGVVVQF